MTKSPNTARVQEASQARPRSTISETLACCHHTRDARTGPKEARKHGETGVSPSHAGWHTISANPFAFARSPSTYLHVAMGGLWGGSVFFFLVKLLFPTVTHHFRPTLVSLSHVVSCSSDRGRSESRAESEVQLSSKSSRRPGYPGTAGPTRTSSRNTGRVGGADPRGGGGGGS